jgi:hypothetical protein
VRCDSFFFLPSSLLLFPLSSSFRALKECLEWVIIVIRQTYISTITASYYYQPSFPTVPPPPATMIIARRFSITNFAIATSALGFQVFVLYPWHNKLDEDFKDLKQENLRLMEEVEKHRAADLREIKDAFTRLKLSQ